VQYYQPIDKSNASVFQQQNWVKILLRNESCHLVIYSSTLQNFAHQLKHCNEYKGEHEGVGKTLIQHKLKLSAIFWWWVKLFLVDKYAFWLYFY